LRQCQQRALNVSCARRPVAVFHNRTYNRNYGCSACAHPFKLKSTIHWVKFHNPRSTSGGVYNLRGRLFSHSFPYTALATQKFIYGRKQLASSPFGYKPVAGYEFINQWVSQCFYILV